MKTRLTWIVISVSLFAGVASAQETRLELPCEVPDGPETHFFVQFEVPENIVEIEVRHDDLSSENILDWGLDDPNGFRGWGGGNEDNAIVGEQAASRSYIYGPIPAGTWEVVVGKAKIMEPPQCEIEVFLRKEATLPPQTRTPYEDPGVLVDEARWYAGDFHVHTRESGDAQPTIGEALEFAQGVGLDFVMLSEHNTNSGLTLYGEVQKDFSELLIVPGVEWTTYSGHANALGATEWVDHKIGVRDMTTAEAIRQFQDQGALFSINHPTVPGGNLCIGCPWEIPVDPGVINGVEVRSAVWSAIDYWEEICANGSHAAAVGGSDDHDGGQRVTPLITPIGTPTTMVFAEELSVEAIIEGVRNGRTAVKLNGVDDPMLETELSGERVGDTVFASSTTLSAVVTGGRGDTLEVIKNGEVIETVSISTDPFTHETSVEAPSSGEDRYRHQVISGIDLLTVGSYVWLRASDMPASSDSGCSCRTADSTEYDTAWLIAVFAALAGWRRRGATS